MRLARSIALLCLLSLPSLAQELRLIHAPPAMVDGKDLVFQARLPGASNVVANLFWRNRDERRFQSLQMTVDGDALTAILPGLKVHGAIEYYLQALYGRDLDHEAGFHDGVNPQVLSPLQMATAAAAEAGQRIELTEDPAKPKGVLPSGVRSPVFAYAALGSSVVVAGAGAFLALQAKSSAEALSSSTTTDDYASKRTKAQGWANATTVAWIGAGALAALGATFLLIRF